MSVEDAIKEAVSRALPTLRPQTIFKHATQLQALFGDLVDREVIKRNPAKRLYRKPKPEIRDKEKTRNWQDAEIGALFNSPVWTGMKNATRCTHPGSVIVRDARYWVPLLLAFHGARLNEICQLLVSDIKCWTEDETQIHYLHITDLIGVDEGIRASRKRIKNLGSRRRVPIHSVVVDLGFLEFVEKQCALGYRRLFPELPISIRGLFSAALSKWFSRSGGYRDAIGLAQDLKLQGLRHTAITKMAHAEVHREVINQVVGHTGNGVGERVYTKDRELAKVRAAVEKIAYPGLDIEKLRKMGAKAA